jgi:hypothetical protein
VSPDATRAAPAARANQTPSDQHVHGLHGLHGSHGGDSREGESIVNFGEWDAIQRAYQPEHPGRKLVHVELLRARAIAPEVARERGYFSQHVLARLDEMGLQRYKGLVIPIHGVKGPVVDTEHTHAILRPDEPPLGVGKYLNPKGRKCVIDVPPRARPWLENIDIPLVITEGPMKADAAVSVGLCCVALLGVWLWKRDGEPLPDWRKIPLRDRRVIIAFDSDVMTKPEVYKALVELSDFLSERGAGVEYVYLPDREDGAKLGIDDWLAAGHTVAEFWALVTPELRAPDAEVESFEDIPDEPLAEILDDVSTWFRNHVAYADPSHADAVALWAMHTHLIARAISTPRLAFFSQLEGSGKTRNLELLQHVVRVPLFETSISASALYRVIEKQHPSVLLDELDTVFSALSESNELLRAVLNAGHRRGATVTRCVTQNGEIEVVEFDCFAPVALAGIKAERMPSTLRSRTIEIPMRRRAPGERVIPYRERVTPREGRGLRRRLEAWARRHGAEVPDEPATVPVGLSDRPRDCWEPLLAIAQAAGDVWVKRAWEACAALLAKGNEMNEEVQLLADLRDVFRDVEQGHGLFTRDVLAGLIAMEDRPYRTRRHGLPIDANWLAARLKGFGIKPGDLHTPTEHLKGYVRSAFEDTWSRYLSARPDEG